MMNNINVINVNDIRSISSLDKEFLQFDLDSNNINKIVLQIMYYLEHGLKKFVLNYNVHNIDMPVSKVLEKIKMNNLYKLIKKYDIILGFKGFPKCIFEKDIMRPALRRYFGDNIMFFEGEHCSSVCKLNACHLCMYSSVCKGICQNYIDKFGTDEFYPLVSNEKLYDINLEAVESFSSEIIKAKAKEVLEDFKSAPSYMRKRFVFVKSSPMQLKESSDDRFIYYILNRDDDFEDNYKFLTKFFEEDFLQKFKNYLLKSNQFALSYGIMKGNKLRKTFYFSINDLNEEEIMNISKLVSLDISYENVWGLGIDFVEDEVNYKLYYDHENIQINQIKEFLADFDLDHKRVALRFANSLIKPIHNILFNYKYKNGKLYSKKIDISLFDNNFRLQQFGPLFNINMKDFFNKDLYTLSIEVSHDNMEKINFYYSLRLPDQDEEEE